MSNLFDRMFGRKTEGSSSKAKDRLQFVLVHDRINLPPERMQEMKEEILAVISKYVTVDRSSVDIALEQRDHRNSKLVAEIPVMQQRTPATLDEDDDLRVKKDTAKTAQTDEKKAITDTPKAAKPDVSEAGVTTAKSETDQAGQDDGGTEPRTKVRASEADDGEVSVTDEPSAGDDGGSGADD